MKYSVVMEDLKCQGLEGVGAGLLLGGQDGHDLVQKSDCGDGCKALGID